MCGIAGLFNLDKAAPSPPERLVAAMTATLAHRGPDGSGLLVHGRCALGHRRLSIIDLATGDQPMVSADGRTAIAFNGEIYNYRALKRTLPAADFRTASDTEVLLELYGREGIGCLDRLNGMFAFALHDRESDTLHLVRDRFGVKPLFYAVDGGAAGGPGRLLFGSELKAILAGLGRVPPTDPDALAEYLRFGYVAAPRSIFRGIRKLLPGHRIEVRDGAIRETRWWTPEPVAPERLTGERFLALFEDAVRLRLVADVPVGAFLSGGVDSSAVCAFMARLDVRPKTFTIGFAEAAYDESGPSRVAAAAFGTDHTVRPVDLRGLEDLDRILPFLDEPLADPSAIPTWHVCRAARERVTVALSGDGADELFGGYERYLFARAARLARRLTGFGPLKSRTALRLLERGVRTLAGAAGSLPAANRLIKFLSFAGRQGDPYPASVEYFREDEIGAAFPHAPSPAYARLEAPPESEADYLRSVLAEDFDWYLPNDILVKLDRMSMAVALEARTPFLDYRIVEFARSLPVAAKIRGTRLKVFLKSALAGIVPAELLARPKRGFAIPLAEWLAGAWHGPLRDELLAADSCAREIFGAAAIAALLDEHRSGRLNRAFPLYNLLVLSRWRRSVAPGPSAIADSGR